MILLTDSNDSNKRIQKKKIKKQANGSSVILNC